MTRGPDPADRSPEPADDRELAVEAAAKRAWIRRDAVSPGGSKRQRWAFKAGFHAGFDAAMAAADERERELDGALTQAVTMANDLGGEVKDLTEALRRLVAASRRAAASLPENHPEQTLLLLAADRARSLLPVPVEGEREAFKQRLARAVERNREALDLLAADDGPVEGEPEEEN